MMTLLRRGYEKLISPRSKRKLRQLLPYPGLWAKIGSSRIPISCVTGEKSRLHRPESVECSHSGDWMAISMLEMDAQTRALAPTSKKELRALVASLDRLIDLI